MKLFFVNFVLIVLLLFLYSFKITNASSYGSINCTAKTSICGNIIKEQGEDCDNSDLSSQTCQSRGFFGGSLRCDIACTFDISGCTMSGGGGIIAQFISPLSLQFQRIDANDDNKVNILDFNILINNWGAVGLNIADFNNDKVVDLLDFNLLIIFWTI